MAAITKMPNDRPSGDVTMWDSFRSGLRQSGLPWLFILPSALAMFLITFIPQAYQIWISFRDFKAENLGGAPAPWVGFLNFYEILTGQLNVPQYNFLPLLGFNIVWTFVNVFFHVALGLAIAIALNGKFVLFRRAYRAIFVIPWALPAYITGLIWNNMWQENSGGINLLAGSINKAFGTNLSTRTAWLTTMDRPIDLRNIIPPIVVIVCAVLAFLVGRYLLKNGLRDKQTGKLSVDKTVFGLGGLILLVLSFLATGYDIVTGNVANSTASLFFERAGAPVLAFYAVLISNIWLGWPFMMVVATGALTSIPPDLYEAADVDGASKLAQFWKITLPMIRPAMVPAIMLGTIWTFNQFNVIFFITAGGPRSQTDLLITQAYKLIAQEQLYGAASAFAIVVFFILLIITLIQNRITRATEAAY
ncbi:MAG: sugar ABC transporter permease [Anaerolineae bacterium]|nr:sugar ABC transporter permease [Anaerolineae bacterium]MCA9907043.1 sugar ABC transporter permease [Anaerolineae bacterium]